MHTVSGMHALIVAGFIVYLGVLSLTRSANFGSLFQNHTPVTLLNRSAVSANFGLIDMSKSVENGHQNVPV